MSRKNLANPTSLGTLKEVDIPEMFFYIKNPRIPNGIWNDMMEKRRRVIEQKIDKYEELDEDDADV